MRKEKNGKIVVMAVVLLSFFFLSVTCTKSGNVQDTEYTETKAEIILPEATLVIGGYEFDPYSKIQGFFRLEIGPEKCADLEGIEQLENVTDLVLSITVDDFRDFSPLRRLSKLKVLYIYGSLKEIPDLSGLSSLKSLTIEVDDVYDFSPLCRLSTLESLRIKGDLKEIPDLSGGLPNLRHLAFDSAFLSSLGGLEKMPQLTRFLISFNKIPVTDTTALRYLKNLEFIRFMYGIYNINLHDLSVLSNLEELTFAGCGTVDLSGIGQLQSLKELVLNSNDHHILNERSTYLHLEEISALTSLKEIFIDESISSVEFLARNSNLESITLYADEEREDYWYPDRFLPLDVSPLRNLKKLSYFSSRGFALKNTDALEGVGTVLINHSR